MVVNYYLYLKPSLPIKMVGFHIPHLLRCSIFAQFFTSLSKWQDLAFLYIWKLNWHQISSIWPLKLYEAKLPYAHHYNPRFVHFYPNFHFGLYCRVVYNAERLIFHDFFKEALQVAVSILLCCTHLDRLYYGLYCRAICITGYLIAKSKK